MTVAAEPQGALVGWEGGDRVAKFTVCRTRHTSTPPANRRLRRTSSSSAAASASVAARERPRNS
jgi:hypothetical protein